MRTVSLLIWMAASGVAWADAGHVEVVLDGSSRVVPPEFDVQGDGTELWLDARFDQQRAQLDLWDLPNEAAIGGDLAELTDGVALRLQDADDQLALGRPGDEVEGELWLEADALGGYTISFDVSVTSKRDGRRLRLLAKDLYDAPAGGRRPVVDAPRVEVGAESGCDATDWDDGEDESYERGGCDDVDWSSDEDDGRGSDDSSGCDGDDWDSDSDDGAGCDGDDWDSDDDDGSSLDCDGDALAAGTPRRRSRWVVRLFNWGPWFGVVLFIHGMRRRR